MLDPLMNVGMTERFLLYIDILGFADMTRKEPRKVARIYSILDDLNVHRHNAFKTIVFSDTVLVYNPVVAATRDESEYLVWYLIEFAEDLHHRLTGQDAFFRAVITLGDFSHYGLKNIECFYGAALINAYLAEKKLPSVGVFIDDRCNAFNKYFRTERFNGDFSFVYMNRAMEELNTLAGGNFPLPTWDHSLEDLTPFLPWQVQFLKDVHANMRTHPDPNVRGKFLTAWDFYQKRYPKMARVLEQSGFNVDSLAGRPAWKSESLNMQRDIRHFKRIGSGSSLSMQISGSKPKKVRSSRSLRKTP